MWERINLRMRIYVVLGALLFITSMGGITMIWYTYRMDGMINNIIDKDLAAFQVVEALEKALVNQKGFVSYYFLDNDPEWLKELGVYRQIFKERLKEAIELVETDQQRKLINQIELNYNDYIEQKDIVIEYYKAGERETGAELHKSVRDLFFNTLSLCEEYKNLYTKEIKDVRRQSVEQAGRLRVIAASAIICAIVLAFVLAFTLVRHVLEPVRKIALAAVRGSSFSESVDEVKALSIGVRDLIEDMDQAQTELEKSRESLIQSEKMAMVGKLAANVAHSIRNPLTSVKMRLFSLSRTLQMSKNQEEDFEVISEEINHIDTIMQNFLEFSRPPKLTILKVSPSEIVDMALQLLQHRIESYDARVELDRAKRLPSIPVDPEQLKEVIVNIIINACEAMQQGGVIRVVEYEEQDKELGNVVCIKLSDNGSGIPESIREKVFQPFYTTKQDGTGLGLSIATRIIENLGGRIDLSSVENKGTSFIIILPMSVY